MPEKFTPPPRSPEAQKSKEGFKELTALFEEAEKVFETGGREPAKPYLPNIYNKLMELNKWDKANWFSIEWNRRGAFTEEEFNELNLRRKKLSNAIGIVVTNPDGTTYVRHDVNKI